MKRLSSWDSTSFTARALPPPSLQWQYHGALSTRNMLQPYLLLALKTIPPPRKPVRTWRVLWSILFVMVSYEVIAASRRIILSIYSSSDRRAIYYLLCIPGLWYYGAMIGDHLLPANSSNGSLGAPSSNSRAPSPHSLLSPYRRRAGMASSRPYLDVPPFFPYQTGLENTIECGQEPVWPT